LPDTAQAARLMHLAQQTYQNNPPKSIEYAQRAQALARRTHTPFIEGRCMLLEAMAMATMGLKPDSAVALAERALQIIRPNATPDEHASSLNGLAIVYRRLGDTPRAIRSLLVAAEILERTGTSPNRLMQVYANLSANYDDLGDYNKSLSYSLKALPLALQHGQPHNQAGIYNSVGSAYLHTKDYAKALEYYQRAHAAFRQVGNQLGVAGTLMNTAMVYDQMHKTDSALAMYRQAINTFAAIGDVNGLGVSYFNFANGHLTASRFDLALLYADSSAHFFGIVQDTTQMAESLALKAEALRRLGQPAQAVALLRGLVQQAHDSPDLKLAETVTLNLYKALRDAGQYREALEAQDRYIAIRDSLRSRESSLEMGRMQGAFETEREVQEAQYQERLAAALQAEAFERQASMQYIALFLTVLVLLGLTVVVRQRRILARWGGSLSFIAVVMLFELVVVFLEPYIQAWSNNLPVGLFVGNLCLALLFTPLHGWLSKRLQPNVQANATPSAHGAARPREGQQG
jgi:tetratricopeptide (TPR) repeat protein